MDEAEYGFLKREWFPVARSQDVPEGVIVKSRILNVDLVLMRHQGRASVLDAWCPHRGMDLSMGTIVDGAIECTYHGWQFNSESGRCTLIPSLEPGSHPGTSRVPLYPVAEHLGHIWSCLSEPRVPLPTIPDIDESWGWRVRCGDPHDLHCGMRQLTENFRDMAHFPFVHRVSMGPNVARVVAPYTVERDGRSLKWTVPTDLGGTALGGNTAVAAKLLMTYHLTLPTFSRIRSQFPDGGTRYTIQIVTPLDREGEYSRQFWLVATDRTVVESHGVSIDEMWEYERQIFEEDWPIVENQRAREAPLDLRAQAHTRSDTFSIRYRQLYQEFVTSESGSAKTDAGAQAGQIAESASGRPS